MLFSLMLLMLDLKLWVSGTAVVVDSDVLIFVVLFCSSWGC